MLLNKEIEKLIYKDLTNNVENENWVEHFYDLWLERYHAMDIVRSASDVIKLSRTVLLKLIKDYDFDELHLFKIYENANVFVLLKEQEENNWSYQFFVVLKNKQEEIVANLQTVEEIKVYFSNEEPTLEIPLPRDRKYVE